MTPAEVRELFAFNAWASRRIFDGVGQLAPVDYLRDLKSSHGGIHGTLCHIVWAEQLWLQRWLGKPAPPVPQGKDLASLADRRPRGGEGEAGRGRFPRDLTQAKLAESAVTQRKRRAKPRWQRRKDERPAELLAAALEVFVEKGFAATKLADVARRAGVTKGTVYLYFDSKEALFKAVVRETIVPVIAQGEALARAFTGSARELVERLVREYWRLVGETALAGIPKLMMAEAATFPELTRFYYDEVVTRGHRLMAGVIERGIKNGEFRPVDVMIAAKLAMSPLIHAVVARRAFASCMPEAFDVQKYLDTHIDLYLHGIAKQ